MQSRAGHVHRRGGFSLVELMVVIGIIAILVAVILPMVSKVRTAARTTASANMISQLSQAITTYHADYRGYPGPLAYDEIHSATATSSPWLPYAGATARFAAGFTLPTAASGFDITSQTSNQMATKFTDSENLVLGLMGGLRVGTAGTELGKLVYDPALVGNGAMALSQNAIGKKGTPYITDTNQLSWHDTGSGKTGHYSDDSGDADDTIIPEFVDNYSPPMPILYLRARAGVTPHAETVPPAAALPTAIDNSIITFDSSDNQASTPRVGTFDLHQIIAYTGMYSGTWPSMTLVADPTMSASGTHCVGEGKSLKTYYKSGMSSTVALPFHGLSQPPKPAAVLGPTNDANYDFPYNAYPYFRNNSISSPAVPKAQHNDDYILISAGPDRVYGTSDDITNFGSVAQ